MKNKPVFGKPSAPSSEVGVVVSTENEIAKIRPQSSSICESCGSKSLCFPSDGQQTLISATNKIGAVAGDVVSLTQSEGIRISAALIVFGIPVAGTLGGTLLGIQATGDPSGGAAVGAIAGFALGLILVRGINRIFKALGSAMPIISEVLGHHVEALHQ